MKISFDNALGIHTKALTFRSSRAEVIATNLINADTPGFKARDIRFKDTLKSVSSPSVSLQRTNHRHLGSASGDMSSEQLYRVPLQASIDGNTVDAEIEESNYMRNALEFQASFTFLNGKLKGLSSAIKGD